MPYIKSPRKVSTTKYDYIVIGGGTAGCVVASRLSENPQYSVLLIERGPIVTSWVSRVPLISSNFSDQKAPVYKWQSAPLQGIKGESLTLVTGKALGGSTKINGLLYSRSTPGEYNAWEHAGRKNWGWRNVEPAFKKSEHSLSHSESPSRGTSGPWQNQGVKKEHFIPVSRNVQVATSLGIPLSEANSPYGLSTACTLLDATIDLEKHRCSVDHAFLPKTLVNQRENLFVCTETVAVSLDLKSSDVGLQAVGVFIESENTKTEGRFLVSCSAEVILCAGAIASPQLLLLSGIGPRDHLLSMGIPTKKDLPGVGTHLQDHLSVPLIYKTPLKDSIEVLIGQPFTAAREFLKYLWNGKGIIGQQVQQANVVLRSSDISDNLDIRASRPEGTDLPTDVSDIEIMFLPVNATEQQFDGLGKSFGAFSYLCTVLRPKSMGSVRLASLDPRQQPLCDLGTLSKIEDFGPLAKALKLAQLFANKVKESGYPMEGLLVPSDTTDAELLAFATKNAMSTYHYSSSCRMDKEISMGVVDDELRVHGVMGLRIADASIFPHIPACHLQAPVVMVAERCAEFVKASNLNQL